MATSRDQKLLKATVFPPEFNVKVNTKKVNLEVLKKWIAGKITAILGSEDEIVIETCFNLLEEERPNIKEIQISLTGFLGPSAGSFCKELWQLCISAQDSPSGVPKELLEAKKQELIQERIEQEKAANEAKKRREAEDTRDRDMDDLRYKERNERGRGRGRGGPRGGYRGERGDRGGRYDRRSPRRDSRSPPRRRLAQDSYKPPGDRRGNARSRSRSRTRRRHTSPSPSRSPMIVTGDKSPPRRRSFSPHERRQPDSYVPSRDRGHDRGIARSRSPRRLSSPSRSRSPPPKRSRYRSRTRSPSRRRYRGGDRGGDRRRYARDRSSTPPRRRHSPSPRRKFTRRTRSRSMASSRSRSPPRRRRDDSRRRTATGSRSVSPRKERRKGHRGPTKSPATSPSDDEKGRRADLNKEPTTFRPSASPDRSVSPIRADAMDQ